MKATRHLPHPDVSEWLSEPTASDDGLFKTWTTTPDHSEGEKLPFAIHHERDFMMEGDDVVQDYNFLVYLFGRPDNPTRARAYLDDVSEVGVIPPDGKSRVPSEVMLYLRKRFRKITVLGDDGYEKVWSA
ncbi:hypothetical protein BPTFM16_01721 [Altererythrobacter insulae]|nr:hypothetical protein BPTFM16_01721 [Altererythrobacter insulae]